MCNPKQPSNLFDGKNEKKLHHEKYERLDNGKDSRLRHRFSSSDIIVRCIVVGFKMHGDFKKGIQN